MEFEAASCVCGDCYFSLLSLRHLSGSHHGNKNTTLSSKKNLLLFSCVRTARWWVMRQFFTIIHYFTIIIFFSGGRPYTHSPRVYPCNEISSLGNQTWLTNDWKLIENWLIEIISKMKFLLRHLEWLAGMPCWCSLNAFRSTSWWDLS
jgi:hypothetical protein